MEKKEEILLKTIDENIANLILNRPKSQNALSKGLLEELLKELNDAQKRAVRSDSSQALILAGAGSGKTKVLVHRINLRRVTL